VTTERLHVPLSREEKIAWLAQVPLFAGCSPENIERLADASGEQVFAPGQVLITQGQVGNGLYLVVSGEVRITTGDEDLARLGPGETIGELSVIDQEPRVATAIAEGETVCLALASWDLIAMLERDPSLAMNLLRTLASRLRRADARLRH